MKAHLVMYGISDITQALGVRDDVEMLYEAMDVFVFPAVTEGQPNALIEAMLSGVPVVASDIAAIRGALPEAPAPRLFLPGDAAEAVQVIQRLRGTVGSESDRLRHWARGRYDLADNLDAALRRLVNA